MQSFGSSSKVSGDKRVIWLHILRYSSTGLLFLGFKVEKTQRSSEEGKKQDGVGNKIVN